MRIAVLDGFEVCEILQCGLTLLGHSVDTFITLDSFLYFINKESEISPSDRCDLIIIDNLLSTEGYSGEQVLHNVRKKYPTLPALLLLSSRPEIPLIGIEELSNIQIIQKPFTFSTLLAAIEAVVLSK